MFLRIDNRLIHGQILNAWLPAVGTRALLVANDEVAADPVIREILLAAVPEGWTAAISSVSDAVAELASGAGAQQPRFVIVKDPQDAVRVAQESGAITHINIGNLHYARGKRKLTPHMYVDDSDLDALRALHELGVVIDTRWLPSDQSHDIAKLLAR